MRVITWLFFCDFLEEYSQLKERSVAVNGVVFNIRLLFFTCDAPAQQFLKCVKGHKGERSEIKGESIDGRLVMAAIDCPSRTDQLFNQYNYHPLHQLSRCTLWYFVYFWICPWLQAFSLLGCNKVNLNIHERRTKIIKIVPATVALVIKQSWKY